MPTPEIQNRDPQTGRVINEDGSVINIADLALGVGSKALVTRSKINDFLEKGNLYVASNLFTSVADGATARIIFTVGSNDALSVGLKVSSSGKGISKIYRAPIFTGGISVPIFNRKTDSANIPLTVVLHTPTISNSGTLVYTDLIGGAGAGNNKVGGVSDNGGIDALLAKNSKTMFEITNTSGSDSDIAIQFFFVEPF